MKKIYIIALLFSAEISFAQNPLVKLWDYRYGGTSGEWFSSCQRTNDNGYILGGSANSGISGDKTQPIWGGEYDFWIVKLDSLGNKQWDKDYGGTDRDVLYSLQQTKDGGYILGGFSNSDIGGNKTQATWGGYDYWIVKVDSLGTYQWDKDFGGTDDETLDHIEQANDGGYILIGYSESSVGGDKTEASYGVEDFWIVKTDSLGNKLWDKDFGGTSHDWFPTGFQTNDGGYVVAGESWSGINGNKTQPNWGYDDFWIIKIDSLGNYQWDKDFGGTGSEWVGCFCKTSYEDYVLGGSSTSDISGDKSQPNWGSDDFWIIKIDSLGNKVWDKDFGGTDQDGLNAIIQTSDKGFFLAGDSHSPISGDKTENNLSTQGQTWMIKIDSIGNKEWDRTLQTSNRGNFIPRPLQNSNGYYTVACETGAEIGGDKTQEAWDSTSDYWIIKFYDSTGAYLHMPSSLFSSGTTSGCPNSCFDFTNESQNATTYQWFFTGGNPASSTQQNPSNICYANPGAYDVMLIASSAFASDTLVQTGYITIFTPLAVSISQNGNFLSCNPAASSYQWSLNGYQIPGATSQTLSISQTGNYSVDVVDSNGCSSSAIINVNSVPSPNFSAADTSLCEKFCISFIDQSTNNPASWQWIFPGGSPSSSTDQNPLNICYNQPGIYDVTLITSNALGNDTLTLNNYITVYATPPSPSITQVDYTLTSSPAFSYQWQLNSFNIPSATNQSYTVLQSGYYTVIVADSNGCVNSAAQYVLISGIANQLSDQNILLEPNPSNGNFLLLINSVVEGKFQIQIFNAIGQNIFSEEETPRSSSFSKEIHLSAPAGIYLITVLAGEKIWQKKIVIEKQ